MGLRDRHAAPALRPQASRPPLACKVTKERAGRPRSGSAVANPDEICRAGDARPESIAPCRSRSASPPFRSRSGPCRNRTPLSIEPSVTPVAANRQSPVTMSSISYFLRGSLIPILTARLALLLGVEHQPALHLPADAARAPPPPARPPARRRCRYKCRCRSCPVGGVDDAGDVAVGDQAAPRRQPCAPRRSGRHGAAGRA